ncbi:sirohydrochlorin chelatase [Embleya sp. NPDC050493]|uniref:sirohydrochlorin chelatase n=1 Tax=Embleya sp. NPDC050493 TaxID=3363989 RepID=UPI0037B52D26
MSSSSDAASPLPARTPGLPTRVPQPRQGGRHRRPDSHELPEAAKPLILAVPGPANADLLALVSEVALLAGADLPGLDIRPLVMEEGETDLAAVMRGAPSAVVVPLLLGPHAESAARIEAVLAGAEGEFLRCGVLGPHPLLAEVLHERLSEAGLARADRARLFSVATAAEGIVLVTDGGPEAVAAAEVTGVLLAARLALPVMTADLGDPKTVLAAAERLREMGAASIALAPHVLGPDVETGRIAEVAAQAGCTAAEPIGAHTSVAKLILHKYLEACG